MWNTRANFKTLKTYIGLVKLLKYLQSEQVH